jgi:PPOX class probable F420-dependent enzyme
MVELTPEARELLGARNMAHLATLMPDGSPHVSPVWVGIEGDRLATFSTAPHLKVRNMRRDGRVAISVCDEHNPYRSVLVRGRVVEEIEGPAAVEIMDRISNRYVGTDFPVRTAIVSFIEPERVHYQELPFTHEAHPDRSSASPAPRG